MRVRAWSLNVVKNASRMVLSNGRRRNLGSVTDGRKLCWKTPASRAANVVGGDLDRMLPGCRMITRVML